MCWAPPIATQDRVVAELAQYDDVFEENVTVEHRIWAADDGAFVIARVRIGRRPLVVAKGALGHLQTGDRARLRGRWVDHSKHGRQIQVISAEPIDPTGSAEIADYLAKTMSHVGRRLAQRLVDEHGDDTFAVLDADAKAALRSLRLPEAKVSEAAGDWHAARSGRDLYMLLAPHRLLRLLDPLTRRFGAQAVARLRADPYDVVRYRGVGFESADRLAQAVGVPADSPRRAQAAVLHCLQDASSNGHTRLPVDDLLGRAARLLKAPLDPTALSGLEQRGDVCVDGGWAQTRAAEEMERKLTAALRRLLQSTPTPKVGVPDDRPEEIGLTDEQWQAVRRAFTYGASVITGGPGTGKSTLVKAIVALAGKADLSVALCAPTGVAAVRLAEVSGHDASTIHSLLGINQHGGVQVETGGLDADIIVCDETSMVDTEVAAHLLDAARDGARVVLVGDVDQLPSVGAGAVLADLISSRKVPTTRLTRIFRQAERSLLVVGAHAIREGRAPSMTSEDPEAVRDLFWIPEPRAGQLLELTCDLIADRLPSWLGVDPRRDVLCLVPTHRDPVGRHALNRALADRLNPHGDPILDGEARVGDRLMWTKNSPDLGLMNGSLVQCVSALDGGDLECVDEAGVTRRIPKKKTRSLIRAYAATVHKAQGCEAPVVVIVLHSSAHHALLNTRLLYTAVTRARRACVIVGDPQAFATALANQQGDIRYTGLPERLVRLA